MLIGGLTFRRKKEPEKKATRARFGELNLVRSIITPEKMRLLREIKESNPSSIYELAKSLKRDIKSVRNDLKKLEDVGFIELNYIKKSRKSKIEKVKPILKIGKLNVVIEIA